MKDFSLLLFILLISSGCELLKQEEEDDPVAKKTVSLAGSYVVDCEADAPDSTLEKATFTTSNAEISYEGFSSDTTCNAANKFDKIRYTYTYSYDGATMTLTRVAAFYIPYDATDVSDMNTNTSCGYNDWAVGVEKDLTGKGSGCFVDVTAGSTITVSVQQNNEDFIIDSKTYVKQ